MRAAGRSTPCAVRVERGDEVLDPRGRRDRGDRDDRDVALAERAQRGDEVAPGAHGDLAEVGLGDDEHVGHLHDPGLQELQDVARAGLHDDGDGVGGLGDLGLGLADADGLDHDDVERRRQRLGGGARGRREPAEPLAGGGRADEQPAVGRVAVDPRPVAEQRAAGALGGRVDRQHRHLRPSARHARVSADSSVDLPAPGGPVTPTTCAGASPPSRAGATSASSAAISGRRSASGSPAGSARPAPRSGRARAAARPARRRSQASHDDPARSAWEGAAAPAVVAQVARVASRSRSPTRRRRSGTARAAAPARR